MQNIDYLIVVIFENYAFCEHDFLVKHRIAEYDK